MSDATRPAHAGTADRRERLPRWTAALVTVLVHALLLLLAWLQPPVTVTSPQASESGGGLAVTWIDRTLEPPPPTPDTTPAPPVRAPAARTPARAPRAATRVRSTAVARADDPVPPEADDTTDNAAESPVPEPVASEPAPAPPAASDDPPRPAPPASTARTSPRRPDYMQGQPPGMRLEDLAPARAGPGRSPAAGQGHTRNVSAGTSLEVDGYQVYYELISEDRLRAWRDQGISELFLPLPGTRRLMVCPLEVALRRGSGACRMVEPDAPELAAIGDARQVIFMQRVFRLGEPVWNGPGPYR